VVEVRLGQCVVDRARRLILRGAEAVRIAPKAFQLLEILLDEAPRVVPKAELLERLWPDAVVVEANLSNLVGHVRAAIGDSSDRPHLLKTVHGFGYGFAYPPPTLSSQALENERLVSCWLIHAGRQTPLPEGEHLIGRHPRSVVPIMDPTVSRTHAAITVKREQGVWQARITDLGSRNGTAVRCVPVHAPRILISGDSVQVGLVELEFIVNDYRDPTDRIMKLALE